jgi:PAS domain S-box-containing protein
MVGKSDKEYNELKASEEKLRCVFAASPLAITCSDLEGKITDCNQATVAMHGFSSKEELIGKSAFDLIAERDRAQALENLKRALEEGVVKGVEYTLLKKDGSEFPAELSAGLIRDVQGKPISFMAITMDITQRKKREKELKVRNKSIESSISAIAIASPDGKILFVNDIFLKMWGMEDASEALGKFAGELFWKNKEKPFEILQILKEKGSWNGRMEARKKDGSIFEVHIAASVAFDDKGKPIALTASFIDQDIWEVLVVKPTVQFE